jgi:hypothetical protein
VLPFRALNKPGFGLGLSIRLRCLRGDTTAEQDASFVAAILDGGYAVDDLSQWLGEARNSN